MLFLTLFIVADRKYTTETQLPPFHNGTPKNPLRTGAVTTIGRKGKWSEHNYLPLTMVEIFFKKFFNSFKPGVPFMGHKQTA